MDNAAQATTTAIRICVGFEEVHPCVSDGRGGRVYAVEEWPWSGEAVTRTHGICDECMDAWVAKDAIQ